MVKCRKTWCFFQVEKVMTMGGIHLPESQIQEKDEVSIKAIGPNVKEIKVGDNVIIVLKDVIRYEDLEAKEKEMRGFVKEENIVALIVKE